jgi:protoporphyrinogen/coproporphyrinogen III oxidase
VPPCLRGEKEIMIRVAIVGGGISGLTAAFYLEQERRKGAPLEIIVFESDSRFGGVIRTERVEGCLIEAGPDSFLSSKPWARELCDDLRLSNQLIGSRDAERKTYVLVHGRLEEIPEGLHMMVPTKLAPLLLSRFFSPSTKLAMLSEYLLPPEPLGVDDDESVASFFSRHFNAEVVDRLADPLLSGVYGGDASRLSARATLPAMVESEARHRSLVRSALESRKNHNASGTPSLFTSLRDGMQRIIDSILRQFRRETLRPSSPVSMLRPGSSGWNVTSKGVEEEFDHVILAVPPQLTTRFMKDIPESERPVEILGELSSTSAVTVALGYKRAELRLPPGFGFLVPRSEHKRIMACTFVHNKFENRAPQEMALLRVFLGGARDPEVLELGDDEILELVRRELREILKIQPEPRFARVSKWPNAMPQYEVGHLLRVASLEMHMQRFPGLHLAGNAYHGIGIPDCARIGRSAADAIIRRMRSQLVTYS